MLSCLISHHICEIMSCYSVCLDNINVNYFMPCFLPYYPLHLSILQCLYNYFSSLSAISIGGVMAVSVGVKHGLQKKILLPVDGDSTPVVIVRLDVYSFTMCLLKWLACHKSQTCRRWKHDGMI